MKKFLLKKMQFKRLLFFLLLPSLILPNNSMAADRYLRCQGRLVSIGDTKEEVLDKCDKPDKREQWEEDKNSTISQIYDYKNDRYMAPKVIKQPILMERWTYNLGPNRLLRYLYFQNGELIKIETGERGRD